MRVVAYSDGSSRGNPGPGGFGAVLLYTDPAGQTHKRELSQGYQRTTNNRMELMGAIAALGWIRRGWKTSQKQPVKNVDLWNRLLAAMAPHDVSFVWVKGHAGHDLNERCDELATTAADGDALVDDEGFSDADV